MRPRVVQLRCEVNDTNHEKLIELLLADELSVEQQNQLCELAAADESIADEVLDQMWLEPLLRDTFRSNPDVFVERIEAALDGDDADTTQFAQRVLDAWTQRSARRSRRRMIGAIAGTSLILAILAVLFLPDWSGRTVQAASQPQVQHASGTVEIVDSNGKSRRVVLGMRIEPGNTITTTGESSATVTWDDGSRVTLTRDASLQWPIDEAGKVLLGAGLAVVERSAPVDSVPLVFATQHATVEVPDATFILATSDRQTDVTVRRGKALLNGSDGKSVDVSNGECGIANCQSVEVRKGSATPDSWSEDFENGLPGGWQGTLIKAELPEGSRGAVQMTQTQNEDGESCHQLWSYSDWEHGLAVVHADTCLKFVYRFKTADTVQVLTLLRSPIPDSAAYEVQILEPSDVPKAERWWNIPANEWYTVSIPLARLTNPVSLEHPPESFVATAFNFRAQNHAYRLAIDRMWLERGPSKKIEFKPLELQRNSQ